MSNKINKFLNAHGICVLYSVIITICFACACAKVCEQRNAINTLNEHMAGVVEENERLRDYVYLLQISESNYAQLSREYDMLSNTHTQLLTEYRSGDVWTSADLRRVIRMVIAESGNQSLEGQMAVAQCIYDRYKNGYGGDTISEILSAPRQFTEPWAGDIMQYPQACVAVARVFIFGERVFDEDVIYFYNPEIADAHAVATFEANNKYLGTIDDHVFRSW